MELVDDKPSLTRRVTSGAFWSGISRVGLQATSLVTMAVVARLLPPSAFGLMGMAQLVLGLLTILRDLGTSSALIQRRELDARLLASAFWCNAILGGLATLACVALAPVAAAFYRQEEIEPVLRALAVSFALTNVAGVHSALLTREFAFKALAIRELVAATVSMVTAIACALAGLGVWSLVWSTLAGAFAGTLLLFLATKWRPTWQFHWEDVRSIWQFGLPLTGFNLLNYFSRSADSLMVGRYLGANQLGFYQTAYQVMLYPVQNIAQIVGRVLYPAFSEVQNNHEVFRAAYLRCCAAIAFLTFPMMAGLAILADVFVLVLLGPQWSTVARVLVILAPVGMVQSVITTVGQIYTAKGRTDLMFRWGLFASTLTVLSFAAGLRWGVTGVAAAYATVTFLLLIPAFLVPFRLIDLRLIALWRALWPGMLCAAAMTVGVWLLRAGLDRIDGLRPIVVLLVCSFAGAAFYLSLAWLLRIPVLQDLLHVSGLRPTARRPAA